MHTTNNKNNTKINTYPNPGHDYLYIEIPGNNGKARIDIYDISGKQIKSTSLSKSGYLNINDIPKGMYIFKVQNENNNYSGKFIVN